MYGTFDKVRGRGWDASWDEVKVKKMFFLKPNKGHLRQRQRPERAAKISKAMEGMPERLLKYEQEVRDRKPKKDVLSLFARVARISKVKVSQAPPPKRGPPLKKAAGGKKKK